MDMVKRLKSMRLTKDEQNELLLHLLDKVEPKGETPADLLLAADTVEAAEKILGERGRLSGLTTGYPSLDLMTKGLAKGDLIIVYGDTSHGKSQLTQNIAYNLARKEHPILFVGLEMTNAQNTTRFLEIGEGDPLRDTALLHILYPNSNDIGYPTIESHIKSAAEAGVELVVIDQLQQLTRSIDNATSETSMITHEIKRMAVRYEIPVILISHINRSGQQNTAPTLRELKGSSSIEQDADVCIAVWRDMEESHDKRHVLEVWLRKNRNRGMEHTHTQLVVQDSIKLREMFRPI